MGCFSLETNQIIACVAFAAMAAISYILDNYAVRECMRYLAAVPNPEDTKKHTTVALSLIATVVLALGPLGYTMLDNHPCGAWFWWTLSLLFTAYSFYSIARISRWARISIVLIVTSMFLFYARKSIYSHTELDYFFVHPGAFLARGNGEWMLLVSGENTRISIFNVQMILQDTVTARAIPDEPDQDKRVAMIRGGTIEKDYPEIAPTFLGDQIVWRPIDVNDQEYSIQARYRIGNKAFLSTEEIRIINIGRRFVSAQDMRENPVWQESITVKNQLGEVLMHCVDSRFPRDARWTPGPPCYPGPNFGPLPRSFCARCFGRGFEFIK